MSSLPDWRDIDSYPNPARGTVTLEAWAWEFLRRNKTFQDDFEWTVRPDWPVFQKIQEGKPFFDSHLLSIGLLDYMPFFERWGFYFGSSSNEWFDVKVAAPECPANFDSKSLTYTAPVRFYLPLKFAFEPGNGYDPECESDGTLAAHENRHIAWVKIDLRRPLEYQLTDIRHFAEAHQASLIASGQRFSIERSRPHTTKYRDYLRVLDARNVGARPAEIAKVLFPLIPNRYPANSGSKRVDNYRVKATALRDGGWRALIADGISNILTDSKLPKQPQRKSRV